jgi:hypothetical protein
MEVRAKAFAQVRSRFTYPVAVATLELAKRPRAVVAQLQAVIAVPPFDWCERVGP